MTVETPKRRGERGPGRSKETRCGMIFRIGDQQLRCVDRDGHDRKQHRIYTRAHGYLLVEHDMHRRGRAGRPLLKKTLDAALARGAKNADALEESLRRTFDRGTSDLVLR